MAIDVEVETIIPIGQAPSHFPRPAEGRKISDHSVFRYSHNGVPDGKGGRIVLETLIIGGNRRYTSVEAIRRFINARNSISQVAPSSAAEQSAEKRKARARAICAAKLPGRPA